MGNLEPWFTKLDVDRLVEAGQNALLKKENQRHVTMHAYKNLVFVADMVRNVTVPLSLSDYNLLEQLKASLVFRSQPFLMVFLNLVNKVLIHHFIAKPLFY